MNVWSCSDPQLVAAIAAKSAGTLNVKGSRLPLDKTVRGKVAVVQLVGVMVKYPYFDPWMQSLTISTLQLRATINDLTADPDIGGVLFVVDSPGGQALGTAELSDAVHALSEAKPTVAYVDGLMASAALYAMSGVRKIVATRGSLIGSIGTFLVLVDSSEMMSNVGIKVIPVRSSELKGIGIPGAELTEPQLASMRRFIDVVNLQFLNDVQKRRRLSQGRLEMASTGEVFTANRAMQLGLVDAIGTIGTAMSMLGVNNTDALPRSMGPSAADVVAHESRDREAKNRLTKSVNLLMR